MNPAPSSYSMKKYLKSFDKTYNQIKFRTKNSLNIEIVLNKSRTFEDIQKTIKMNLTKVRDKREGAG
jgi:hypothetical protein